MAHQVRWCEAFQRGLSRHGIKAPLLAVEDYRPSDVAVFWSHRFVPEGQEYICLEKGFVGNPENDACYWNGDCYASAGWNGLNGRADFCNREVNGNRGARFEGLLKPFRMGQYILIMGQVRGDEAIKGIDFEQWAAQMAGDCQSQISKPVYFRPHPKDWGMTIPGARTLKATLAEALEGAHWVVTYNSSSAVEAALAGVPVSACDEGSMAWEVAGHGAEYRIASFEDRRSWLNRLAYTQWTFSEMMNGDTWAHLRARLN